MFKEVYSAKKMLGYVPNLIFFILLQVLLSNAAVVPDSTTTKSLSSQPSLPGIFVDDWNDVCDLLQQHPSDLCFHKSNLTSTEQKVFRAVLSGVCQQKSLSLQNCSVISTISKNFTRPLCLSRCWGPSPSWMKQGTSTCLSNDGLTSWCGSYSSGSTMSQAQDGGPPASPASNAGASSFRFSFGILMLCLAMVTAVELQIAFLKS